MKTRFRALVAAAAALLTVPATHAATAEDYAHEDAFKHLVLSPDGQTLAYSQTIKGDHIVFLLNLASGEKVGINLETSNKVLQRDATYFWSTSKRFVCQYGRDYYTVDRDGRDAKVTIPFGELVYNFRDEKNGTLLINGYEMTQATGMGRFNEFVVLPRPFVHRVNTIEGRRIGSGTVASTRSPIIRVVDNPGRVLSWVATSDGQVLAGTEFKDDKFRVIYRSSTKHENWQALPGLDWQDPSSSAAGFSQDGKTLYVSRVGPEGTWALYPYDLSAQTLGKVMAGSDRYDLFRPFIRGGTNGVGQNELVYTPKERRLIGVHYNVDVPKTIWLDQGMAEAQIALDQTLPGKTNNIVSFSDDLKRLVLLSWSAEDPGTYYLFDRDKVSLEPLFKRRPWVNAEESGQVKRFKFKNREGIELSGYATLPPGRKPAKLPTLIIAGGTNRALWDYDGFDQFFAGKGYLVINLNHRGRAGLGEPFVTDAGSRPIMLRASDDIADAVNWAVKVGLADPERVAIRGYGGTSGLLALLSVQENPGLFQCAFVNEPMVDMTKQVDRSRLNPWFYEQAVKMLGDPETPEGLAKLKSISPALNGKPIAIPVLVQHKDDIFGSEWIYNLTQDFVKKAGANVTFIHDYDEKFGYQTLAKYWQEDLDFLQQHMPAGDGTL